MEKVFVEVYLPAQGRAYELSIPRALNTFMAAQLAAKALEPLSENCYRQSGNSVFAWRKGGQLLDMRLSMEQANVKNGSKLLLI